MNSPGERYGILKYFIEVLEFQGPMGPLFKEPLKSGWLQTNERTHRFIYIDKSIGKEFNASIVSDKAYTSRKYLDILHTD